MKNSLHRTFLYISRSKPLSITTVFMITATFFITSIFSINAYGSHKLLNYFESQAQVTAFFKDEATEAQILSIKEKFERSDDVEEVTYTSKEEALQIYTGRFQEDPALLESISANILPASLDIKPTNLGDLNGIEELLNQEPLVEDVFFHRDVVERLKTLTQGARLLQITLVGLLALVSTFVVIITISLIIYSKKKEIEIMQLIGATPWQIRWPFVLQGVLYCTTAALISSAVIIPALPQLIPYFESTLMGSLSVQLIETDPTLYTAVFAGQLLMGIILGALGSFWATWRYLK